MPPIGLLVGRMDFTKLAITLKAGQGEVPAVLLKYGMFIQQTIDFIIVAFAIFMMIKAHEQAAPEAGGGPRGLPPSPPGRKSLLAEIRDLLKK